MEKYEVSINVEGTKQSYYIECFSQHGIQSHLYFLAALHERLGNTVEDNIRKNLTLNITGIAGSISYTATKVN